MHSAHLTMIFPTGEQADAFGYGSSMAEAIADASRKLTEKYEELRVQKEQGK